MGTLSKVRDNSQKIIWAFLITFILSMVAGGLMGGFNLVGQFKEWIGFNTSDQHAFSLDDERITHQSYASIYESNSQQSDDINMFAHLSALNFFKQRNATNELYEDVFNSNQVSDIDILTSISPTTILTDGITLNQIFLKGFSEQYKDRNSNGLWDKAEPFLDGNSKYDEGEEFVDANENGKWDEGEEFTDVKNGKYDEGEFIAATHDRNDNGQWDDAEKFTDIKNGKYDEGEEFTDVKNGKYDEGEKYTDTNENGKWDEGEEFTDVKNGKYDEGEKFVDGNGLWDSNIREWINQCIKDGKINYSVIEDPYFRQIVKNRLNPSGQNYKINKLNSVSESLKHTTNHEIQFEDDLNNTTINTNYVKYDLSDIDEQNIIIDEKELKSKITPYEKYNSGFSHITLIIITLLFFVYSYTNRENRAKLSFGGFFFIAMLLITLFKYIDYNDQGSDSLRKISYVYITKAPGNNKWDEGEEFTDTNANGVYDDGERFKDTLNGVYDKGEEFTDTNANEVYDLGEEFIDAPASDINQLKNDIVKNINSEGIDIKFLEENELDKSYFENINIVKNFVFDNKVNSITQFNLLPNIINETFEVDLGSYFVIEDKSGTDINGYIIGFVHSEENYYAFAEYEKLKNEFIAQEKQKRAKEKLNDLVETAKDKNLTTEDIKAAFDSFSDNETSVSSGSANGSISKIVVPSNEDFVVEIDGLQSQNNANIIGTLSSMNEGDGSDVIFSNDNLHAYVFHVTSKSFVDTDLDYEEERKKQSSRQRIQSNSFYSDIINDLNVMDWRSDASITVTVDPDTRATQNLSDLYFDINSYLQLRNTLFNR